MPVVMVSVLAQSLAETAINKAVEELTEYSYEAFCVDRQDEKWFFHGNLDVQLSSFICYDNRDITEQPNLCALLSEYRQYDSSREQVRQHSYCVQGNLVAGMSAMDIYNHKQQLAKTYNSCENDINENVMYNSDDGKLKQSDCLAKQGILKQTEFAMKQISKPDPTAHLPSSVSEGEAVDTKASSMVLPKYTVKQDTLSTDRLCNGVAGNVSSLNITADDGADTNVQNTCETRNGHTAMALSPRGQSSFCNTDHLHVELGHKNEQGSEPVTESVQKPDHRELAHERTLLCDSNAGSNQYQEDIEIINNNLLQSKFSSVESDLSIESEYNGASVAVSTANSSVGISDSDSSKTQSPACGDRMNHVDQAFLERERDSQLEFNPSLPQTPASGLIATSPDSMPGTSNTLPVDDKRPQCESENKLVGKKTFLVSKLPIKKGSVGSSKSFERRGLASSCSKHLYKDKDEIESDSCSSPDKENQEFERCLFNAEGGEKRRSRGLWSQSWNPESIIQTGSKQSETGQNNLSQPHSSQNSREKVNSSAEPHNMEPTVCYESTGSASDKDENITNSVYSCHSLPNQEKSSEASDENTPVSLQSDITRQQYKCCAKVPEEIASGLCNAQNHQRIRKLNLSDSCIPVHISGGQKSPSRDQSNIHRQQRPLSASAASAPRQLSESNTAVVDRKSAPYLLCGSDVEGTAAKADSFRNFDLNESQELPDHEQTIVSQSSTCEAMDQSFPRVCSLFGPLSSTPVKLPGATKHTLRQKQVMEVSPSIEHIAAESSLSSRPSTLNMTDLESASDDASYMDGGLSEKMTREAVHTLKAKHSRQIHDLQAYYEAELQRLQEEISELHRRVVSRPSSSPMIRLKYLEQIREELDQRCQQFERRNNQLQEDCERWSQRCFEMERRCRTSECERQTVYERCSRLEQEKGKVEAELLRTQEMLNESFRERRQLEEHLLSLQRQELEWSGRFSQENHAIGELQSELKSTRELCADKDDTIKTLEQQRDELRRNLDNTTQQVEELKQTMCFSTKDRDLFQKLLEEYEALYRQHQKMRAMYKDAIEKMESNAVEVDVLKGLLSKLENDCSKLRESKELLYGPSDSKSKIPVRADNQIKKKDSFTRRDLFKSSLTIFQSPSSSSVDLTASDNESIHSDKPLDKYYGKRNKKMSTLEGGKDFKSDRRNQLTTKCEDLAVSPMSRVLGEGFFAGSMWEAAEKERSKAVSYGQRTLKEPQKSQLVSQPPMTWNVPFSDDSPKPKPRTNLFKKNTQMDRKLSKDSTCSESSKQSSPVTTRKEQNWVIESRGGVTRFDVVFDTPNKLKSQKQKEIIKAEKELDTYGPPSSSSKRPERVKTTSCSSTGNDSDSDFFTKFSSADSTPKVHTKKEHKAGRTSTLLAGEKDAKAYEERMLKVSDLEKEFKKLTQEKETIESQLRKIPTGRTTRKKLDEKEALEERLEQVLKRIGTVRMNLRRFDAL